MDDKFYEINKIKLKLNTEDLLWLILKEKEKLGEKGEKIKVTYPLLLNILDYLRYNLQGTSIKSNLGIEPIFNILEIKPEDRNRKLFYSIMNGVFEIKINRNHKIYEYYKNYKNRIRSDYDFYYWSDWQWNLVDFTKECQKIVHQYFKEQFNHEKIY